MSFENLNLNPALLKAIAETGYTEPTEIQAKAIPELMAGHDLMASSQTGSGKTAAFILPALNRLAERSTQPGKGPRVLVLTPTRELAQQVCNAATTYGKHMRVKTVSILGGMPYPVQNRMLSGFVDILVATPGRLIDHMERGRIDFSRLEVLILDEADRMLDMGFVDAVEQIADATPASRQTLLFSATLEGVVGNLASRLLKNPKQISIAAAKDKHENIEQRLMITDDVAHKNKLLNHLLTDAEVNQAVVFTATKRDADDLADQLLAQGLSAAALHGDMSQRERNRTLLSLRRGDVRILVATDVAARGIDIKGISHVINFDLPRFAEDYVHRIGRTGRGGQSGIAISFASNRDVQLLKRIERYTEQSIKLHTIEGLEPKFKLRTGGGSGDRGPRRGGNGGANNGRPARQGQGQERSYGGGYANGNNFGNRHPRSSDENRNAPRRESRGGQPQDNANQPPRWNQERSFGKPRQEQRGNQQRDQRQGNTSFALGRGHNGNSY